MKKLLLTVTTLIFCIATFSQSRKSKEKDEEEEIVYYPANWTAYRDRFSVPPYGLDKIQELIKKAKNDKGFNTVLLPDSSDGYMYTSPVGHFAPNPWGLYDMYGNVFEFCSGAVRPDEKESLSHARGGSWWCSARSCHYFNSYNIGRVNKRASFSNQGFRVAVSRLQGRPTD
jgi:hypothetical protein